MSTTRRSFLAGSFALLAAPLAARAQHDLDARGLHSRLLAETLDAGRSSSSAVMIAKRSGIDLLTRAEYESVLLADHARRVAACELHRILRDATRRANTVRRSRETLRETLHANASATARLEQRDGSVDHSFVHPGSARWKSAPDVGGIVIAPSLTLDCTAAARRAARSTAGNAASPRVRRAAATLRSIEVGVGGVDYALRLRAQMLMAEGRLPSAIPFRMVVGFGSGKTCALCEELIFSTEPEVELHFWARAFDPYFFHRPCYDLWLAERLRAK